MLPHLAEFFGNPSSGHRYADAPRRALAEARAQVAALIGARPAEIVFTASGSEANLLALRGALRATYALRTTADPAPTDPGSPWRRRT
jgi:cysteine desulfurase